MLCINEQFHLEYKNENCKVLFILPFNSISSVLCWYKIIRKSWRDEANWKQTEGNTFQTFQVKNYSFRCYSFFGDKYTFISDIYFWRVKQYGKNNNNNNIKRSKHPSSINVNLWKIKKYLNILCFFYTYITYIYTYIYIYFLWKR